MKDKRMSKVYFYARMYLDRKVLHDVFAYERLKGLVDEKKLTFDEIKLVFREGLRYYSNFPHYDDFLCDRGIVMKNCFVSNNSITIHFDMYGTCIKILTFINGWNKKTEFPPVSKTAKKYYNNKIEDWIDQSASVAYKKFLKYHGIKH